MCAIGTWSPLSSFFPMHSTVSRVLFATSSCKALSMPMYICKLIIRSLWKQMVLNDYFNPVFTVWYKERYNDLEKYVCSLKDNDFIIEHYHSCAALTVNHVSINHFGKWICVQVVKQLYIGCKINTFFYFMVFR